MSRSFHSASLIAMFLTVVAVRSPGQSAASNDAVSAMQRGDFVSAERILRAAVKAEPEDAWTLSLLGVAIDSQKRVPEAEEFHQRAVQRAPASPNILNNYGTHLWYAGRYGEAETAFASALAADPGYFKVLYNLGVMATYNHHYERAREVLESALRQQPQNVDVWYRLACVEEASQQWEAAVARLAQAARFDPRRPDVQRLLALTTGELGALDDAAAAWDRYLTMEPNDEVARRERGYTAVKMGKFEQGVTDIEWFLARHENDPVGHYELGQALRTLDLPKAMTHLDRALALDPKYVPALVARGSLNNQQGKPEAAVKDLELAASLMPDDGQNLDRLGQTYLALDRPADAVAVLRRAVERVPGDSKTLLHLGRALGEAGKAEESKMVMDRFRKLGAEKTKSVPAGLVEYLSLTPEQRHAEYRARVESAVREHPDDLATQVAYLKLSIQDGKKDAVAVAADRIAGMKPGERELAEAGHALLEGAYYSLAVRVLEHAGGGLDLALAIFLAGDGEAGAKSGLAAMEHVPRAERDGEYYLVRARMIEAAGRREEAAQAFSQAQKQPTNRPAFYLRATAYQVQRDSAAAALEVIQDAAQRFPDSREIALMHATTLEFAHQTDEALRLLKGMQSRWPEWQNAWIAKGMLLATHAQFEEARQSLEMAVKLGTQIPATYYYLADCLLHGSAPGTTAAEALVVEALQQFPSDPWLQALAVRSALQGGNFQQVIARGQQALQLRPRFSEVHRALAEAYRRLDRRAEAEAELALSGVSDEEKASPYLTLLFQGKLFQDQGEGNR